MIGLNRYKYKNHTLSYHDFNHQQILLAKLSVSRCTVLLVTRLIFHVLYLLLPLEY